MSYRLRLILWYKDGTNRELTIQCPSDIADSIAKKGLTLAQVFVDKFIQIQAGLEIDKFKKGG